MTIRELPTTDGIPTCEVETAQELTERLVPGVYVRAPRAVLDACGWTDTENADTAEIVAGADWRDDAWIARGATSHAPDHAEAIGGGIPSDPP